ncbi:MAG: hypothetical protein WC747_01895 [Candidatus Babeliales bacterium]|jgi:cysteinyl-tRNA synthetase
MSHSSRASFVSSNFSLQAIPEKQVALTLEIQQLLQQREQARVDKNWKLSDELRDKLTALGVDVHDKKLK